MNKAKSEKRYASFTAEENEQLTALAKQANMKPTQYMKEKALDPSGDSILRRQIIRTMSQFYTAAENLESIDARNLFKEVAEQLWQSVK